jgi:photosystem II stability/assembly factor-like uncharacterized protein
MSDPVDGHYVLISTIDGGQNWRQIVGNQMPAAKDGEAAFAASGTCLITHGRTGSFLVSGGNDARVFRSTDRGLTWKVADTPITKGTAGSGIFSIAMLDAKTGVIVGGNYEKPGEANDNLAFTSDSGKTWKAGSGSKGLSGYRSAVAYAANGGKTMIIAVGSNGADVSTDRGKTWNKVSADNLNAVASKGKALWAVGANGGIFQILGSLPMRVNHDAR